MNALRGRWENFFSSEQVCVVRLETREDLIKKLVYIATSPVYIATNPVPPGWSRG